MAGDVVNVGLGRRRLILQLGDLSIDVAQVRRLEVCLGGHDLLDLPINLAPQISHFLGEADEGMVVAIHHRPLKVGKRLGRGQRGHLLTEIGKAMAILTMLADEFFLGLFELLLDSVAIE